MTKMCSFISKKVLGQMIGRKKHNTSRKSRVINRQFCHGLTVGLGFFLFCSGNSSLHPCITTKSFLEFEMWLKMRITSILNLSLYVFIGFSNNDVTFMPITSLFVDLQNDNKRPTNGRFPP